MAKNKKTVEDKKSEDTVEEREIEVKETLSEEKPASALGEGGSELAASPDIPAEGEEVAEGRYFALSPVVRLMKEEVGQDKIIRGRVKTSMVEWLELVVRKVSKNMNRSEYTVINEDDFRTAIEPYEKIDELKDERQQIVSYLDKIKMDCDSLISKINERRMSFIQMSSLGQQAQAGQKEVDEPTEEESSRYFAMSPTVRLMKEELDNDKIIRIHVKKGIVSWLEDIVRKVSKKMKDTPYDAVEMEDFKLAIEPYTRIDDVEEERNRIIATLEKIKQDCDSLARDVNRKFTV